MKVLRAAEDYLEAMLLLQRQKGFIRSVDVAAYLGVTKPSVSYTAKRLKESGYITMEPEGPIHLTEQGMAIASSMLERHETIAGFLESLGVDSSVAQRDACRIEHDLSEESFQALYRFCHKP